MDDVFCFSKNLDFWVFLVHPTVVLVLPFKHLFAPTSRSRMSDNFEFLHLGDFFRFSKNLDFWVFLVHPTVVSVLLSASVERCFVSRMRDFFFILKPNRVMCCCYKSSFSTTTFSFPAMGNAFLTDRCSGGCHTNTICTN